MQWLFDIIMGMVLKLGYLTGAEVLEWTAPVGVSGELRPDATCVYLRGGTHNGQPYYKRSDGAYFIWTDEYEFWLITEELGVISAPLWQSFEKELYGDYENVWGCLGIATVTDGQKVLCKSFIYRGDPDDHDYHIGDFIIDSAWHELDLSVHVPEGAKAVVLLLILQATLTHATLTIKKGGQVNNFNVSSTLTQAANIIIAEDIIVAVNENRIIEYNAKTTIDTRLDLTIKGWWL